MTRSRWHTAALALGVAVGLDALVTLEWSFPTCMNPEDGPLPALFGFPLPHEHASQVTSLVYEFAPHLYAFDIAVIAGVLAPVLHALARTRLLWVARVLAIGGAAVAIMMRALPAVLGLWVPVGSITTPPHVTLELVRPVGVTIDRSRECTRSEFWFDDDRSTLTISR